MPTIHFYADEILEELSIDEIISYLEDNSNELDYDDRKRLSDLSDNISNDEYEDVYFVQYVADYIKRNHTVSGFLMDKKDFIDRLTQLIDDNFYRIKRC